MIFNVNEIAKNDWSPYCLDYTVVIDILTSQKSSVLEMDFDDSNDSNESSNNVYTYTPCTGLKKNYQTPPCGHDHLII